MAAEMPIQHHATTLDEFLAPIKERLGHTGNEPKPVFDATLAQTPHVTDELDQAALIERFCAEAAALGTELSRCTRENVGRTVVHVVQENGAENLEQKHQMVATMEQYLPEDAIIASSSSGTPVTKIASEAKHPERIIVAHPFNPAYLLPLIEICGGEKTDPAVIQQAIEFYKMYDKAPVYVKIEKNGFIANRLMHALWREEIALVTEGVCSMADADDAWTFGPGIRLAAFGPAMNYELGGGDLGLKGCAIKFGAMTNAVFADISDMKAVPDTWADQSGDEIGPLMEAFPEVIGHDKASIADFRDNLIINVLKMHKRM